VGLQKDNDVS
jgi:hypothetical protein